MHLVMDYVPTLSMLQKYTKVPKQEILNFLRSVAPNHPVLANLPLQVARRRSLHNHLSNSYDQDNVEAHIDKSTCLYSFASENRQTNGETRSIDQVQPPIPARVRQHKQNDDEDRRQERGTRNRQNVRGLKTHGGRKKRIDIGLEGEAGVEKSRERRVNK